MSKGWQEDMTEAEAEKERSKRKGRETWENRVRQGKEWMAVDGMTLGETRTE